MSIALSETLQVTHKDVGLIQNTPILIPINLPIEEGQPIITRPRRRRVVLLREKEIAKELFHYVLKQAKKRKEPLTLKETVQIINYFIEKHHDEILEYAKTLAQGKLRGVIEVRGTRVEIINKEKYINIILETYQDVKESLSTLILRVLQRKSEGKITNIKSCIKILYSLIDLISLAKTCIEVNKRHHRVLELIRLLNTVVTVTLLRDLALLRIAEKIDEDKIRLVVNEESQLIKEINELILDPDKILSSR